MHKHPVFPNYGITDQIRDLSEEENINETPVSAESINILSPQDAVDLYDKFQLTKRDIKCIMV